MGQRLEQKVALVFGAGSSSAHQTSNGQACALAYAREGARVVAVDLDIERAQKTRSLIEIEGGTAVAVGADVTPFVRGSAFEHPEAQGAGERHGESYRKLQWPAKSARARRREGRRASRPRGGPFVGTFRVRQQTSDEHDTRERDEAHERPQEDRKVFGRLATSHTLPMPPMGTDFLRASARYP